MAKDYLWQRGRQWYLRVSIPLAHRHLFRSGTGKPLVHIVEPLGDSHSVAKLKAAQRVADCTAVFTQIRAGLITTPEQAKAALLRGPSGDQLAMRGEVNEAARRLRAELQAAWFRTYGDVFAPEVGQSAPAGETVTQASEAWLAELTRDKTTAPRATTLGGHRLRVRAFVKQCGDLPLTEVTRAAASDFLAGLKVTNRTRNQYSRTLASVFKSARLRGRYRGEKGQSPFDDQRAKVVGSSYEPFKVDELQKLFDALPREVEPKRHSPDTALPWAALIALYTGARLEEIAQLTTADVREENANGARVWCIDVHNGGENKLKNDSSERLIPVHSELVRLGLLDYVNALKAGPLFPGLTRRASKGGKVGARVGELFRKRLVELGLKRDGLNFHSFRHTVAGALDAAGVPQSDAARVLGHAVSGMSYGTYSQAGPGLKRVAAVVEQITYEGLRLKPASVSTHMREVGE